MLDPAHINMEEIIIMLSLQMYIISNSLRDDLVSWKSQLWGYDSCTDLTDLLLKDATVVQNLVAFL